MFSILIFSRLEGEFLLTANSLFWETNIALWHCDSSIWMELAFVWNSRAKYNLLSLGNSLICCLLFRLFWNSFARRLNCRRNRYLQSKIVDFNCVILQSLSFGFKKHCYKAIPSIALWYGSVVQYTLLSLKMVGAPILMITEVYFIGDRICTSANRRHTASNCRYKPTWYSCKPSFVWRFKSRLLKTRYFHHPVKGIRVPVSSCLQWSFFKKWIWW